MKKILFIFFACSISHMHGMNNSETIKKYLQKIDDETNQITSLNKTLTTQLKQVQNESQRIKQSLFELQQKNETIRKQFQELQNINTTLLNYINKNRQANPFGVFPNEIQKIAKKAGIDLKRKKNKDVNEEISSPTRKKNKK